MNGGKVDREINEDIITIVQWKKKKQFNLIGWKVSAMNLHLMFD